MKNAGVVSCADLMRSLLDFNGQFEKDFDDYLQWSAQDTYDLRIPVSGSESLEEAMMALHDYKRSFDAKVMNLFKNTDINIVDVKDQLNGAWNRNPEVGPKTISDFNATKSSASKAFGVLSFYEYLKWDHYFNEVKTLAKRLWRRTAMAQKSAERNIGIVVGSGELPMKYDYPLAYRIRDYYGLDEMKIVTDSDFHSSTEYQKLTIISLGGPFVNKVTKEICEIYPSSAPLLSSEHLSTSVFIQGGFHQQQLPDCMMFDCCLAVWGLDEKTTKEGVNYLIKGHGQYWLEAIIETLRMERIPNPQSIWATRYWNK